MWYRLVFILITLISAIVLFACNSETSTTTSIRKEMHDEALKYYTMMNERIDKAEDLPQEDHIKIQAFINKYNIQLKELNEKERNLVMSMVNMSASFNTIQVSNLIHDDKLLKESIEAYVQDKIEVGKILGVSSK